MTHVKGVNNRTSMDDSTLSMKKVQTQQKLSCNHLHSPNRQSPMFEPCRLMIKMISQNIKDKTDMLAIRTLVLELATKREHMMTALVLCSAR